MQALLGDLRLRWKRQQMVRQHDPRFVCKKGTTEICIEGYPRSANTYAVRMFNTTNKGHVAHHTHATGNVELALGFGMPTLVLLREPRDAIASACVYRKTSVDQELPAWISFYQYVFDKRADLVVAAFEVVTSDINRVIEAVNVKFGSGFFLIEDLAGAEARVFSDIREATARDGKGADRIPIPTSDRQPMKRQYQSAIRQHPRIGTACSLFDSLMECSVHRSEEQSFRALPERAESL